MKKFDYILIVIAIFMGSMLITKLLSGMIFIKAIVGLITMVMLLYWKLSPYKQQLSPKYQNWFSHIEKCVRPVWNLFRNIPKIQLGHNLSMEAAPFIACSILIIILVLI